MGYYMSLDTKGISGRYIIKRKNKWWFDTIVMGVSIWAFGANRARAIIEAELEALNNKITKESEDGYKN